MLTTNVCTQLGLSNSTVCVVEDFIFNRGDNSTVPGNLPAVIILSSVEEILSLTEQIAGMLKL